MIIIKKGIKEFIDILKSYYVVYLIEKYFLSKKMQTTPSRQRLRKQMLPKMQYCKLHPFKIVILVTRGSIFVVWDQFHTTIHNTFEMCLVSSKYLRASKWAYQVFIIKKHLKWKSSNHGHFLHQAHFKHNVNSLHGINFEFFLKNHYFWKKFDKIIYFGWTYDQNIC